MKSGRGQKLSLTNVNIVMGEPEQVTMHDVTYVIVLYMTRSVCMALTAIQCASGVLTAYVCMNQLSA